MRQDAAGRFSTARRSEIDLFSIYLTTDAKYHTVFKYDLRMIVNNLANDLQFYSKGRYVRSKASL